MMIRRAWEAFPRMLAQLGTLRLAVANHDLADVRHAGWQLILAAWECLALANQTFFERGPGHIIEQVPRLRSKPDDLAAIITTIGTAHNPFEIAAAAENLAVGTRRVLRECQQSLPAQQTVRRRFSDAWPEIHDMMGKVLSACDRRQPVAASAAAWSAQYDVSQMLAGLRKGAGPFDCNLYSEFAEFYREIGLPDLMQSDFDDLAVVAGQALQFDDRMRRWLSEQGVPLNEFATVEEFARFLSC